MVQKGGSPGYHTADLRILSLHAPVVTCRTSDRVLLLMSEGARRVQARSTSRPAITKNSVLASYGRKWLPFMVHGHTFMTLNMQATRVHVKVLILWSTVSFRKLVSCVPKPPMSSLFESMVLDVDACRSIPLTFLSKNGLASLML